MCLPRVLQAHSPPFYTLIHDNESPPVGTKSRFSLALCLAIGFSQWGAFAEGWRCGGGGGQSIDSLVCIFMRHCSNSTQHRFLYWAFNFQDWITTSFLHSSGHRSVPWVPLRPADIFLNNSFIKHTSDYLNLMSHIFSGGTRRDMSPVSYPANSLHLYSKHVQRLTSSHLEFPGLSIIISLLCSPNSHFTGFALESEYPEKHAMENV